MEVGVGVAGCGYKTLKISQNYIRQKYHNSNYSPTFWGINGAPKFEAWGRPCPSLIKHG